MTNVSEKPSLSSFLKVHNGNFDINLVVWEPGVNAKGCLLETGVQASFLVT